jgi:hypothetical protein
MPPVWFVHVNPKGHVLRPGAIAHPGMQVPAGPLQTMPDMGAPHSLSPSVSVHPHVPLARQMGLIPPQRVALVAEHSVQAPASGPDFWHAGRAGSGQSGAPSFWHATQVFVFVSQTGFVPEHCALVRQPTHMLVVVLHTGVAPMQAVVLVAEHCPQAPFGRHAGEPAGHCASFMQPWHIPFVMLQTGVVPVHCVPEVHCTHVPVFVLQTGVPPEHWLSMTHWTHVPVIGLHTGVVPVHWPVLVAEHWPQAPDGWHAGVGLLH